MKSLIEVLTGVTPSRMRGSKQETVTALLLYTLNKHNALQDAIDALTLYTSMSPEDGAVVTLQALTTNPEVALLLSNKKATEVMLQVLPYTQMIGVHPLTVLPTLTTLRQINKISQTFKVFLYKAATYVVVFENKTEMLEELKKAKLLKLKALKECGILP